MSLTMENIRGLIENSLALFPTRIDIGDGELLDDNGFLSKNLSDAWHQAEEKNNVEGNDADFMIWAIYRLLHRKSRENYSDGIYSISLNELSLVSIEEEYKKVKTQ